MILDRPPAGSIAIFGWGVVAPGMRDVAAFSTALDRGHSAVTLTESDALGRGLFAVGDPDFDIETYRPWLVARGGEARFAQLKTKMGENTLFAIGAFIQTLEAAPGLEAALRDLDAQTHVYIGSGLGDLPQSYAAHDALQAATRTWNAFWAHPSRCAARREFQDHARPPPEGPPPPEDPTRCPIDSDARHAARLAWEAYWARRSDALARFEAAYAAVERTPIGDDVDKGPLHAIRARQRAHRKLLDDAGCPPPPWESVDPKLLWSIQNVPAAEVSMLLGTHGPAWAPVGSCATFGVALKCARDAIARGEARAVVVGTTDPRPDPAVVAAFHRARLTPGSGVVNRPLTTLLGAHVAGGACVWVVADVAYMAARGIHPVGPVIAGVAVSSDAEHIITPSADGPARAIRAALAEAGITDPEAIAAWDLHATGTPGDVAELRLAREFVGPRTALSARKGLFGHGMANCGGWELTALALGLRARRAPPTGIPAAAIHPRLRERTGDAAVTTARALDGAVGVKVMLGVGGITACVVLAG